MVRLVIAMGSRVLALEEMADPLLAWYLSSHLDLRVK
jgi:hypothetical protein